MSWKERERLTVMSGVRQQELTLVQAAALLGALTTCATANRPWKNWNAL
jgi:hypothetical protein